MKLAVIAFVVAGGASLAAAEPVVERSRLEVQPGGKPIKQLLLPQGALICLVIDNEGQPRLPTPETTIKAEDILVAVTSIEGEESLRNALTSPVP